MRDFVFLVHTIYNNLIIHHSQWNSLPWNWPGIALAAFSVGRYSQMLLSGSLQQTAGFNVSGTTLYHGDDRDLSCRQQKYGIETFRSAGPNHKCLIFC